MYKHLKETTVCQALQRILLEDGNHLFLPSRTSVPTWSCLVRPWRLHHTLHDAWFLLPTSKLGSVCIHISYNTIWFLWHFPLDSSLSWHFLVILICLLTFGMHGWYKFWGFLQVFACWRHCRVGLLAGWWHCSFWNFCPHIRADKSCKTNCLHNSWRHPVASHIPRKGLVAQQMIEGLRYFRIAPPHTLSTQVLHRQQRALHFGRPDSMARGNTWGGFACKLKPISGSPNVDKQIVRLAILGWWSDTLWTCIYIYIWIY